MFKSIYKGKKIIITGHTGFKGSWLTTWLLKLEANIVGISIDVPTKPSLFEELDLSSKIKDLRLDVRDLKSIQDVFMEEQPDFVFHLAAQPIVSTSYANPVETFSTNVLGTVHVLEALRFLKKKCAAVIVTSDKCYDNVEWIWGYKESDAVGGKDIYSGSKGGSELAFKSYYYSFFKDHPFVTLASARAGNVIGGGDWAKDRIISDTMRAWIIDEKVEIRNPKATRPWQHVLEPLSGYLSLGMNLTGNTAFSGESFNFGPRAEHIFTVDRLLDDLSAHWKFKDENAYIVTGDRQFHEANLLKLNCDKALFHLKWLPVLEYSEMISFTSLWYYEYKMRSKPIWEYTIGQLETYEKLAQKNKIEWTL